MRLIDHGFQCLCVSVDGKHVKWPKGISGWKAEDTEGTINTRGDRTEYNITDLLNPSLLSYHNPRVHHPIARTSPHHLDGVEVQFGDLGDIFDQGREPQQ